MNQNPAEISMLRVTFKCIFCHEAISTRADTISAAALIALGTTFNCSRTPDSVHVFSINCVGLVTVAADPRPERDVILMADDLRVFWRHPYSDADCVALECIDCKWRYKGYYEDQAKIFGKDHAVSENHTVHFVGEWIGPVEMGI